MYNVYNFDKSEFSMAHKSRDDAINAILQFLWELKDTNLVRLSGTDVFVGNAIRFYIFEQ